MRSVYLTSAGFCLDLILERIDLVYQFPRRREADLLFSLFYADALSVFFLFTISVVAFAAALYSARILSRRTWRAA